LSSLVCGDADAAVEDFVAELFVSDRDCLFNLLLGVVNTDRLFLALATNSVFDFGRGGEEVLAAPHALLLRLVLVCLHVRSKVAGERKLLPAKLTVMRFISCGLEREKSRNEIKSKNN
jgi:hypothetical protein